MRLAGTDHGGEDSSHPPSPHGAGTGKKSKGREARPCASSPQVVQAASPLKKGKRARALQKGKSFEMT